MGKILILGVLAPVLICFLALMIVPAIQTAQQTAQQNQQKQQVTSAFSRQVLAMCTNVGSSTTQPPKISGTSKILVLLSGTATIHDLQLSLPAANRATSDSDLDVVLCVQNKDEPGATRSLESCKYTGDVTVPRYKYVLLVVALDARTGKMFAKDLMPGGEPDGCDAEISSQYHRETIYGSPPDANQLVQWVDPLVH
jgi:type II secretory pathway pseudopilin PulG